MKSCKINWRVVCNRKCKWKSCDDGYGYCTRNFIGINKNGCESYIAKDHNHVWRDTVMPTPKDSKEELLISIKNCGAKGFWLKGKEIAFGKELEKEGKVQLCCDGKAATINNKTTSNP